MDDPRGHAFNAQAWLVLSDSYHIQRYVQQNLNVEPDELLDQARFPWIDRHHPFVLFRTHPVQRQQAIIMDLLYDHNQPMIPVQRQVGFSYESLTLARNVNAYPDVRRFVELLDDHFCYWGGRGQVHFNHITALHFQGQDQMGFHSDRDHDLVPDGFTVWLAHTGQCRLEFAQSNGPDGPNGPDEIVHTVILKPGDLFVLGPITNRAYRHAVVRTEADMDTPTTVLVFRQVSTHMTAFDICRRILQKALQLHKRHEKRQRSRMQKRYKS